MKKTVALITLVTVLTVFFCVPVFAAVPSVGGRKTTSSTVSGVTITANADQCGLTVVNTSHLSGSAYTTYFLTVQIYNNNTLPALVNSCAITVNIGSTGVILDFDNFSQDLTIGYYNGTTFAVNPSGDYAYANGIVVPPKGSLYLVSTFNIDAPWTASSGAYVPVTLTSLSIGTFTVGTSASYPYGTPTDFSPIISYLSDYSSGIGDINTTITSLLTALNAFKSANHTDFVNTYNRLGNMLTKLTVLDNIDAELLSLISYTDDVETYLSNILTKLTYTGTIPNSGYINANAQRSAEISDTYYVANTQITAFGSYYMSGDYEAVFPSSYYYNYTYCIPVQVYFRLIVRDDLKFNYLTIDLLDYSGSFNGTCELDHIVSSTFNDTRLYIQNNILKLGVFCTDELAPGTYYFDAWLNLYVMNGTTVPSFPNPITLYIDNIQTVNNTLSDKSDSLASQSSSAHTQEQAFFDQNAQAISNTGLSNYSYGANGDGVSAVSIDFTNLWTALNGWTSVYIFSLTLGLALTIIRHSPNAISRKIRNKSSE